MEIDALIFQNSFRHFHATPLLGRHCLHTFRPKRFVSSFFLLYPFLRFDHLGRETYVDFCANPNWNPFSAHLIFWNLNISTNSLSPLQTRTENEPRPGHMKDLWRKERKSKIHLKTLEEVVPETIPLCVGVDVVEKRVKQERKSKLLARSVRPPHIGRKVGRIVIVIVVVAHLWTSSSFILGFRCCCSFCCTCSSCCCFVLSISCWITLQRKHACLWNIWLYVG